MNHFLKQGLLLATLILGLVFHLMAQSTVMDVYMNDGTIRSFTMDDNDRVYFYNNSFLIIEEAESSHSVRIKLADIRKITCQETVDIPEVQASAISILPNPVHDVMVLRNLNGNQEVQIYSINGQLAKSFEVNGDETIDVSDLSMGVYIVRTQSCTLKMIKL